MGMTLQSSAFQDGGQIPRRYAGDGDNMRPPLSWSGVPAGTRSLALVVDDPDAPGSLPFVHWLIYDLPAELGGLPEGPAGEGLPAGAAQGRNSYGRDAYAGPRPPPGPAHHYRFRLRALDHHAERLPAGLDGRALEVAMEGHALAEAVLVGTYQHR
jgi:Raf kinase inhibitor-like YbhB/YbcL family protein